MTASIQPIDQRVRAIVAEVLGFSAAEVSDLSTLGGDLRADHLELAELLLFLEEEFEIGLEDQEVESAKTVGALVALVQRAREG